VSRAYLLSSDGVRQVTEDHSYVNEAIKRGQSESEATASQWRNVLTRAIGTDPEVVVDLFGPFPLEADTAVLLCSDGLYKALSDGDLRSLFVQSMGPSGAALALVDTALEWGSDDNISVAIAEFGEVPTTREETTVQFQFTPPDDYYGTDDTLDDGPRDTSESTKSIPEEGGVSEAEDDTPKAASEEIAPRTGPRVGTIGAVVVVLLVIAYVILSR
jgi:serine/threonine protein phosphatase PrpC